jgi:hypothetical protein
VCITMCNCACVGVKLVSSVYSDLCHRIPRHTPPHAPHPPPRHSHLLEKICIYKKNGWRNVRKLERQLSAYYSES